LRKGSTTGAAASDGTIPLAVPEIRSNEWKYIEECLNSNWVSSVGPFVHRFEKMIADYVGTRYAVATASGTAALHLSLLVAGVQPDEEVLVSSLTFIAPANAIRYVGAWPVFMDLTEHIIIPYYGNEKYFGAPEFLLRIKQPN